MSELRFLIPAGLLALISLPLVVLFHMRSPTPRAVPVSALRFWRIAAPRPTDEPRFRRPPITPELLLHLAIALLLSLALARPVGDVLAGSLGSSTDPRHLIVLLDGSTSMLAAGSEPGQSRFAEARAVASDRIDALRPGDAATFVLFGSRTITRAASDAGAVDQLARDVAGIPAPGGEADLTAALILAGDLRVPGATNEVILLSDGALAADPAVVSALGVAIEDLRFGSPSQSNAGIIDVWRRNEPGNPSAQQVLATIANFSPDPITLSVALAADGVPVTSREITLGPDQRQDVVFSAPAGTALATVSLAPGDGQALDDVATVQLDAGGSGALDVLIFSDQPDPLARAFGALAGSSITLETTDAAQNGMGTAGYDLVVYDQVIPQAAPISPALFVSPPDSDYFRSPAMLAESAIADIDVGDPVLREVDLTGVIFGTTPAYEVPDGFSVPIAAADGPLVAYGRLDGSGLPVALIAPPLDAGNLTERIAFPILIANLTAQLAPMPSESTFSLGQSIPITPNSVATQVTVIAPDGQRTTIDVAGDNALQSGYRTFAYTGTEQTGIYTIEERDTDGVLVASRLVSVNAGNPAESDLRANPGLSDTLALATTESGAAADSGDATDLWPVLAAIALLLILAEWALSLRTVQVPGLNAGREQRAEP
jgi:hypothetical protein